MSRGKTNKNPDTARNTATDNRTPTNPDNRTLTNPDRTPTNPDRTPTNPDRTPTNPDKEPPGQGIRGFGFCVLEEAFGRVRGRQRGKGGGEATIAGLPQLLYFFLLPLSRVVGLRDWQRTLPNALGGGWACSLFIYFLIGLNINMGAKRKKTVDWTCFLQWINSINKL
jgi:hypothetical protein